MSRVRHSEYVTYSGDTFVKNKDFKCDSELLDLRATPSSESSAINKALKKNTGSRNTGSQTIYDYDGTKMVFATVACTRMSKDW